MVVGSRTVGSPRPSAASLRRTSPGRANTIQLPPSFERAVQGVEDAGIAAYRSMQSGVERMERQFAPNSPKAGSLRPATQSTVTHKPVFQRASTVSGDMAPMSAPGGLPPPSKPLPSKAGFSNFFVEPGGTAMYVMTAAAGMMIFACWIPFYLGICLLFDRHYRLWIGWEHPLLVVLFSMFMPVVFVGTIYVILQKGQGSGVRAEETMVLVGATFTSLVGVILCLLAIPMCTDAAATIQQLSFGCDLADPTSAKLVFHSQVLHNMRNSIECQAKGSVKDCAGWKSNKYTDYLQHLENDFDCTGLCTLPAPPTAPAAQAAPVVAAHPAAGKVFDGSTGATTGPQGLLLNQQGWERSKSNRTKTTLSSHKTGMQTRASITSEYSDAKYSTISEDMDASVVPALKLYSQEKTDQRCYPLVADRLQVASSTAGELLFWVGVGLLFVSVVAGSVKVVDKTLFEK